MVHVCFSCQKLDDLGPKELPAGNEEEEDEDEDQGMETVVVEAPAEKWDCETIISEFACVRACGLLVSYAALSLPILQLVYRLPSQGVCVCVGGLPSTFVCQRCVCGMPSTFVSHRPVCVWTRFHFFILLFKFLWCVPLFLLMALVSCSTAVIFLTGTYSNLYNRPKIIEEAPKVIKPLL